MTGAPRLDRVIQNTRRKIIASAALRAGAMQLTGLGAGLVASAFIVPFVPRGWSHWVIVSLTLCGFLCGAVAAARFYLKNRHLMTLAGAADTLGVDDRALHELLVTGSDLAKWSGDKADERGASWELVKAQVAYAEERAVGAGPFKDPFGNRNDFSRMLATLLVMVLVLFAGPSGFRSGLSTIIHGGVPDPVSVGNLDVAIIPPAYTGLEKTTHENSEGSVSAYPGSRVVVSGRLSRQVDSGLIKVPGAGPIPLDMGGIGGEGFSAAWTALEAGVYRLAFFEDGKAVPCGFTPRSVTLREDGEPVVELLLPETDMEAKTTDEVAVSYRATDDFGIDRIELVLQGDEEVRLTLRSGLNERLEGPRGGGALLVEGETVFMPAAYPELGAGAYLRIEAWDTDTVNGPKSGGSTSIYLTFMSLSRMQQELEGLESRLLEAMLAHLADHLEFPHPDEKRVERMRGDARDLLKLMETISQRALDGEADGLMGAAALVNIEAGLKPTLAQWVAKGEPFRVETITELERSIIFLDELMRQLSMEQVLGLGEELSALQRDLFDRLRSGESPESLMEAVSNIEKLLSAMVQKLSSNSTMPDGFANSDAVNKGTDSKLSDMLKELKEAIRRGDNERAAELAEELMEMLNQWLDELDEAADMEMAGSSDPMMKKLGELSQKVLEAMAEQERVLGDTRTIADKATGQTVEKLKEMINEFKQRQQKRLAQINRNSAAIERQAPRREGGVHSGEMAGLLEKRTELNQLVRQAGRDLEDAISRVAQEARMIEEKVRELQDEVMGLIDDEGEGAKTDAEESKHQAKQQAKKRDDITRNADEAAKAAREIAEDIESLLADRTESLDQLSREQLDNLSGDQAQLGEMIGEIESELTELAGQSPMIGPGLGGKAGEARQSSGKAQGRLGQHDPFGAMPQESSVLESLAQLSGEMEQSMKNMQGQKPGGQKPSMMRRGQRGRNGRDVDRSRVEIPGEAEARALKAFREDVLKAMREGRYPKEYKREIERYYEGLIR